MEFTDSKDDNRIHKPTFKTYNQAAKLKCSNSWRVWRTYWHSV